LKKIPETDGNKIAQNMTWKGKHPVVTSTSASHLPSSSWAYSIVKVMPDVTSQ
jgi:hypothetical protein